jgi:hypothetical protein
MRNCRIPLQNGGEQDCKKRIRAIPCKTLHNRAKPFKSSICRRRLIPSSLVKAARTTHKHLKSDCPPCFGFFFCSEVGWEESFKKNQNQLKPGYSCKIKLAKSNFQK